MLHFCHGMMAALTEGDRCTFKRVFMCVMAPKRLTESYKIKNNFSQF